MRRVPDPLAVDAVIAVHDASRPIARAVQSLTESGLRVGDGGELRISVVCHNLPLADISARLPDRLRSLVRFIELRDGIASAAGPFNAGLDAATARYVSIMGSDDYLEPGALAAWLGRCGTDEPDAVIAPQRHADGRTVRTPPMRPWRRGPLDPVRDRLSYRTAPLGLIGRAAIERLGLRFPAGLPTGEDQSFSARLWFGGGVLAYASGAPAYVVGADAETRVSTTPRELRREFAFIDQLLDDPWFLAQPRAARGAIAIKVVRIHVFGAVLARIEAGAWTREDHACADALLRRLHELAGGFERPLSVADRRVVAALLDQRSSAEVLGSLSRARRRYGRPGTLLTHDLGSVLAREAPLRFMVASALL